MGSSRLPGKILRMIGDRPLLGHVISRLARLQRAVVVVVATSDTRQDDVVVSWCEQNGVLCFRGSEKDVLDRYWRCACHYTFDHIVRLTADNPFSDIEELDRLISFHLSGNYDYSHSFGQMPLGVGAEIFTLDALRKSHTDGHQPNHREHVNEYIEENPQYFHIGCLKVEDAKISPALRLTVDTEEDWLRASRLVSLVGGRELETEEAISLCSSFV